MEFSAVEIAHIIQGELKGDPQRKVNNFSKIDEGEPETVSFLYHSDYLDHLYTTQASIVIISKNLEIDRELPEHLTLIQVEDARIAFGTLLDTYKKLRSSDSHNGIHPTAHLEDGVELGENVSIGAFTIVGRNTKIGDNSVIHSNCSIGDHVQVGTDTVIHPNVTVYEDCVIGNHCTLLAGAVIGGEGFGFQPNSENNYHKIVHIGNVIIEDHVDVGANTTIDRATIGSTLIRKGVKLDNLIQIGHNVEIDENTVIASQSGVAGSVYIGKNCMIGGQVGFAGHQRIADGSKFAAKTGVPRDVREPNGAYQGNPSMPISDFKRSYVFFRKLPDLNERIEAIEKELNGQKRN